MGMLTDVYVPAPQPRLAEPPVWLRLTLLRLLLVAAAAGGIVLEHGFLKPPVPVNLLRTGQAVLLTLYAFDVLWRSYTGRQPAPGGRPTWVDGILFASAAMGGVLSAGGLEDDAWHLVEMSAGLFFFSEMWRTNVALSRKLARPGLLLPLSFLTLIIIGTVLIKAPVATPPGHPVSWLDALFTMTSAVCVTGLVVRETATTFTPFGHALIAIFIQLGGLGIIIFGSVLALLLGRSLSLRENVNLSQMLNDQPLQNITGFVRFIVLVTLLIELAGAAVMFPLWEAPVGELLTFRERAGMSAFHAISAFCNAGFDITGNSLIPYRYTVLAEVVILVLVVLGGIGFPVLANVGRVARCRAEEFFRRPTLGRDEPVNLTGRRINLHTKIVITTTGALYLYGVFFIAAGQLMPYVYPPANPTVAAQVANTDFEFNTVARAVVDGSFMSLAARTAGFTTMPMDEISATSRFTLMTLMVIGGAPGGTAGGAKVTVLALLVLSVWATMRRREETEAFGRQIADSLVRKAATLGICYLALIVASTLFLALSEPFGFERVFFEVVSAATTTGLSLGITADLTDFGKGVIIVTMFLGRVGPLTLLGALLFTRRARRTYLYAHEDVVLG